MFEKISEHSKPISPVSPASDDGHSVAESQLLTSCAGDAQRDLVEDRMIPSDMSKVLLIYTGGTIGMKYSAKKGYVPAKNYLYSYIKSHPSFCDAVFQSQHFFEHLHGDPLISDPIFTPSSVYGKRICLQMIEYCPLLDSSNMTMEQWVKIASDVERYYSHFDAFIILHGTDTMAFTASSLSFMLENLSKTVIITGSQIPLSEVRNDGVENIMGALTIAGHYCIPEVCIYFNHKLFRGNRCSKISAIDLDAFDSPNMKPLVTLNTTIEVDWNAIYRPHSIAPFRTHQIVNPNVATIRLFPGITESSVRAFMAPPIQGVVIEAFGCGNFPDNRPELLRVLKEAVDRNVVIVNCTQCKKGRVSESYATSRKLLKMGIVFGSDMTPECALTKLSYCLGKYSPEETRAIMSQNIRGELTMPRTHQFSVQPICLSPESWKEDMSVLKQHVMNLLMCNAASVNDTNSMKDLIASGGKVNCYDYSKRTPLHIAASFGHNDMIELLLINGASVHARDGFGNSVVSFGQKNFIC